MKRSNIRTAAAAVAVAGAGPTTADAEADAAEASIDATATIAVPVALVAAANAVSAEAAAAASIATAAAAVTSTAASVNFSAQCLLNSKTRERIFRSAGFPMKPCRKFPLLFCLSAAVAAALAAAAALADASTTGGNQTVARSNEACACIDEFAASCLLGCWTVAFLNATMPWRNGVTEHHGAFQAKPRACGG